jgi:transposase
MNVRYRVELSEAERHELTALLRGGRHAARTVKRTQILLAADAGESEQAIARHVAVSASTVCRTKRRFVEGNLERALSEEPRPGMARLLSGRKEALLVATACSDPPAGRSRWTRPRFRIRAKSSHKRRHAKTQRLSGNVLLLGRASDFGNPLKKHSSDATDGETISGHQGQAAYACLDA